VRMRNSAESKSAEVRTVNEETRREAIAVLKNRYSCRRFLDKPIPDAVLDDILEVGLNAATGGNLQPVSVVMVRDPERKRKIREYCGQGFIEQADTLLVYLIDFYRIKRWSQVQKAPFGKHLSFNDFIISLEDVMCMAQSMESAANLHGVGNVYIGTVNARYAQMKEVLDLPELTIPVLMLCLGYPDDKGLGRKKLARGVVVHQETYRRLSDDEVKKHIVVDKYDNWMQSLEGEILEKYKDSFFQVTKAVHGEEYAREVVAAIDEQKGINRAQYRLGHHYNPVRLAALNEEVFRFYREQGFAFIPSDG